MAPILTEAQRAINHKTAEFLNSPSTTHPAPRTGLGFHGNIDLAKPSDIFTRNVELSLDPARQVRNKITSLLDPGQIFDMNAKQLSLFLTFDADKNLDDIVKEFNASDLNGILDYVGPFLSTCRGRSAYLDSNLALLSY